MHEHGMKNKTAQKSECFAVVTYKYRIKTKKKENLVTIVFWRVCIRYLF